MPDLPSLARGWAGETERGNRAGWNLDAIRPYMHPPALTAPALTRHYVWADVMALVSRFESSPLTSLEAQRLGCAGPATNVDVVSKLIEEGDTGFPFSNGLDHRCLADAMISRLDVPVEPWNTPIAPSELPAFSADDRRRAPRGPDVCTGPRPAAIRLRQDSLRIGVPRATS